MIKTERYGGIAQLARALGSYPGCRWFKSDCRYHFYGPLVKRLRHRPFTAESWVRFPYGSPHYDTPKWLYRAVWEFFFCTDFGLGLYLVFIAKQQGSHCCSKSLISVTAEVLILNLWSLSREFGFFAALLFFFVKDKCVGDCLSRPCLCFLEHMTVDVRCR